MKFWFYADDGEPENFPQSEVWFSVSPEPAPVIKSREMTKEQLEAYLDHFREARQRFIAELNAVGVEINDEFILAKNIPNARAHSLNFGWKEEYIPFGP